MMAKDQIDEKNRTSKAYILLTKWWYIILGVSEPGKIEFDTFYSQIILPSTHFPETALHATYRSYFM